MKGYLFPRVRPVVFVRLSAVAQSSRCHEPFPPDCSALHDNAGSPMKQSCPGVISQFFRPKQLVLVYNDCVVATNSLEFTDQNNLFGSANPRHLLSTKPPLPTKTTCLGLSVSHAEVQSSPFVSHLTHAVQPDL